VGFLDLGTDLDLSPGEDKSSAASDSFIRRKLCILEEDSGKRLELMSSRSSFDSAENIKASESGGINSAGAVLNSVC
jgi:hypothetical protein